MTIYPDFICYRNDGAGAVYREEAVLHTNADGETVKTIARDLYDGQDDGDTVQVFRLDRAAPTNSADMTAEVVAEMEALHCHDLAYERGEWVHPLIADFAERHWHDQNRAEGTTHDPETGRRYAA